MPEVANKKAVVEIRKVNKIFDVGTQKVHVLHDVDFDVGMGDFLIIFGPSGCGKSTLLHTILGLEGPTSGRISMLGDDLYEGKVEDDRSRFRKEHIGMVYQQANWVKALNVIENVAFPLILLGITKEEAHAQALQRLESVGMKDWANYMPLELSSGQQQRISLARALINDPKVVIADEPTGNLDFESGQMIMQMFADLGKLDKTVIMVTHDLEYLKYSTKVVEMFDGRVAGIYDDSNKEEVLKKVTSKRGIDISEDAGVKKDSEKEKVEIKETVDVLKKEDGK